MSNMKRERKQTKAFVPTRDKEMRSEGEEEEEESTGVSLNSENDCTHSSELEEYDAAEDEYESDGIVYDDADEANYKRFVSRGGGPGGNGRHLLYAADGDSEDDVYSVGSATTSDDSDDGPSSEDSRDTRSRSYSSPPRRRERDYYDDRRRSYDRRRDDRYSRPRSPPRVSSKDAYRLKEKKRSLSTSPPERYRPVVKKYPLPQKKQHRREEAESSRKTAKSFAKAIEKYVPGIETGEHKLRDVMRSIIDREAKTFNALTEQLGVIKAARVEQISKPLAKTAFGDLFIWSRDAETGSIVAERALKSTKLAFLTMPAFCVNQKKLTELFNKHAPEDVQEAMKKRKDKQISRVDWLYTNQHITLEAAVGNDECGQVVFKDKNGKLVSVIQAAAIRANNFMSVTPGPENPVTSKAAGKLVSVAFQMTRLLENHADKLDGKREKKEKPKKSPSRKRPAPSKSTATAPTPKKSVAKEEESGDNDATATAVEEKPVKKTPIKKTPPKKKEKEEQQEEPVVADDQENGAEEEEEEAPPTKKIKKNDGTAEKKKPAKSKPVTASEDESVQAMEVEKKPEPLVAPKATTPTPVAKKPATSALQEKLAQIRKKHTTEQENDPLFDGVTKHQQAKLAAK